MRRDETAAERLVGTDGGTRRLQREIVDLAPLDTTLLVTGETGTGKGRVARLIHDLSPRAREPFVHVDCAALSPSLIESELFGHERGAFTSATHQYTGRFERARSGTIFLDEIGDLEPRLQAKLLRVLEDREFERVGGSQTLRMRARVVAATSHDLHRAVEEARFRPDLYFRLAVFHVELAPLRERADDIPALVDHALRRISERVGRPRPEPTPEFLAALRCHGWPGNVRELINVLEGLSARRAGAPLRACDLEGRLRAPSPVANRLQPRASGAPRRDLPGLLEELADVERREILEALEWAGGNVSGAARRLRIPRGTLRHKLKKMGVE